MISPTFALCASPHRLRYLNHFNNPGWNLIHELLMLLQGRGYNVWGEIYPYEAGSTTINAVFLKPEIWVDQLGNRYEDTLMDPVTNTFYTREQYEKVLRKDPAAVVVIYKMPTEDILKWLSLPGTTMASDGMPIPGNWSWDTPYNQLPNMYPRGFPRSESSHRKGEQHSAHADAGSVELQLGDAGLESMKVRGRMQEGTVADITIFDPERVTDNATYDKGTLPTTGIPRVIVNGVIVVKESKVLKDVSPGRPIRFEPREKASSSR